MRVRALLLTCALVVVVLLAGCICFCDPTTGMILCINGETGEWMLTDGPDELTATFIWGGEGRYRGRSGRGELRHRGPIVELTAPVGEPTVAHGSARIRADLRRGTARGFIKRGGRTVRFRGVACAPTPP